MSCLSGIQVQLFIAAGLVFSGIASAGQHYGSQFTVSAGHTAQLASFLYHSSASASHYHHGKTCRDQVSGANSNQQAVSSVFQYESVRGQSLIQRLPIDRSAKQKLPEILQLGGNQSKTSQTPASASKHDGQSRSGTPPKRQSGFNPQGHS
ncbi:hypothetical protein, partial [Sansalvadorimonas verongulae]|uniref:hypothetical protein n=1 Tax=Sansalvadorimonas verongulae TaxID=2172824 RepID=UPI001E412AC5